MIKNLDDKVSKFYKNLDTKLSFGVPNETVFRLLGNSNFNFKNKRPKFSDYLIINILRHLKRGESIRRTAKLVGSSPGLVQKVKRWAIDHNKLEN